MSPDYTLVSTWVCILMEADGGGQRVENISRSVQSVLGLCSCFIYVIVAPKKHWLNLDVDFTGSRVYVTQMFVVIIVVVVVVVFLRKV